MGAPGSLFEIESFLKNMFNDPLILGIKNNFARKILASFIVQNRLAQSKANYQAIGGGSPMIAHTLALTNKLNALDPSRLYTYAMRYTPPYAIQVLEDIQNQGIDSVCLFSLYPQFSYSTTYSSILDAKNALNQLNFSPTLSFVESYPTHPSYIQCIIEQILKTIHTDKVEDFILLLSAHSLPQSRVDAGDPYQQHCQENAKAIESALKKQGFHFQKVLLAYQSKIGKMKWIGPSTKEIIQQYKKSKILVFPLSFTLNNSETDFELKIAYGQLAKLLNVPDYRVCECFNDSQNFAQSIIAMLELSKPTQEFLNV